MSFPTKLLFGSAALGVTGTGLSFEKLDSSSSQNDDFFTKGKFAGKFISVKKECRIYKLISSYMAGTFERVEKEALKQEIEKDKKGDWPSIEKACLENIGGSIFVSNPERKGWKYLPPSHKWVYSEPQKFKTYLEKLKTT
ncbi:hypothetical protein MHC_01985 [Mycoplasma haemocanis str. Illinois]|uniref:Uncharacterized protein n=1 Tax=Mycoplasma haemocanis (strain Illinois) TaxID=1111676 RepID=H6N6J1_MYCHN|nr:hypothetical protein [Mycoplasma haemocanis]AEW45263.1 hypothetical protein MHC_01985 [Mycoplasma haemocanis str. Illinois]